MLIACIQSDVTFADVDANLNRVLKWMARASDCDLGGSKSAADLLVTPECMLTGYAFDSRDEALETAISIDDPAFSQLADAAARYQQFLTVGFVEFSRDGLFNSQVLIGPEGIVARYRKIHLPFLGVDQYVNRGDQPYRPVEVTMPRVGDVRIGMAICYDASFPEPIRVLALEGADIIALGTNWPTEAKHTARLVPPTRSMENHVYFVAANRVGTENAFSFCGRSSICGPDGVVFAISDDDQETMLIAKVDHRLARNKQIERTPNTHVIDRFSDRQPKFYGRLVEDTDGTRARHVDGDQLSSPFRSKPN
jgi:predicted amidohydrolase